MAIDSSVLLIVQTYSRDRGNRIYGHRQGYRKTTEVQRVQSSTSGIQERQRTAYSRQAVQERLSMFAVRATRQDSEDSTGGALVEGYTRRWLGSVVHIRSPRDPMSTHGRVEERLPWADQYARVTYRYEYVMLRYCQMMTQKAAAGLLRISASTLSDQLHRCIKRIRAGHRIRGLRTIGIDEISYCKGHKYATLVYDLERSPVCQPDPIQSLHGIT